MELLTTKKYRVRERDFEIHTYRDTNNDSLVIQPVEITSGKKEDISYIKSFVHMKGIFDLSPEEYPGYREALIAVEDLLVTYVNEPNS